MLSCIYFLFKIFIHHSTWWGQINISFWFRVPLISHFHMFRRRTFPVSWELPEKIIYLSYLPVVKIVSICYYNMISLRDNIVSTILNSLRGNHWMLYSFVPWNVIYQEDYIILTTIFFYRGTHDADNNICYPCYSCYWVSEACIWVSVTIYNPYVGFAGLIRPLWQPSCQYQR